MRSIEEKDANQSLLWKSKSSTIFTTLKENTHSVICQNSKKNSIGTTIPWSHLLITWSWFRAIWVQRRKKTPNKSLKWSHHWKSCTQFTQCATLLWEPTLTALSHKLMLITWSRKAKWLKKRMASWVCLCTHRTQQVSQHQSKEHISSHKSTRPNKSQEYAETTWSS